MKSERVWFALVTPLGHRLLVGDRGALLIAALCVAAIVLSCVSALPPAVAIIAAAIALILVAEAIMWATVGRDRH